MGFLKRLNDTKKIQKEKEEIVNKIKSWNTRCREFFEWFEKEEGQFGKLFQQKKENEAQCYLLEGLEKTLFGIEGRIAPGKLMFQAKESQEALYLLPSLSAAMPKSLKERWEILPQGKSPLSVLLFACADGTEWEADLEKASVFVRPAEGKKILPLEIFIYLPDLPNMGEEEKNTIAWHIGRAAAGEMKMFWCVSECHMIETKVQGMFPVKRLSDTLQEAFAKMYAGQKTAEIFENMSYYEHQPEAWLKQKVARFDILEGYTSCENLVWEYFERKEETFVKFLKYGVLPMYLYVPADKMNEEIHRKLEQELKALLNRETENQIYGVYLGFSLGERNVYYDFLAFDREACMEQIDRMRQNYEFDFVLSEFRDTWKKMVSRKEKR